MEPLLHQGIGDATSKVDFSCRENIRALVDFHEGKHTLPERFGKLAHHVLLADSLGDDNCVQRF